MSNFYIADWHYGHANIIKYDNRPFFSVDEMNERLIANWNEQVGERDLVYSLGDMFWGAVDKAVPILRQLNGKKILIRGNHDRTGRPEFDSYFDLITDYLEIFDEDFKQNIVLCHYPIPCFNGHHHGWYHLYGHVHNSFEWNMMEHFRDEMDALYEKPCNMINVGAMMPWMDYSPRVFGNIVLDYERWRKTR